jgi:hypothetical protein
MSFQAFPAGIYSDVSKEHQKQLIVQKNVI